MAATLNRQVFETSRLLEFFSEKELTMQIGHDRPKWAIALARELIDNALDACESAGILPDIAVCLDNDSLTISDNGPGLPVKVIERSLDYAVRVSTNNGYVSPTRGQMGNALKCVWAAPYVATGTHGRVDVHTGNTIYTINVTLDRIAQAPQIDIEEKTAFVKNGTSIKMYWPNVAWYLESARIHNFYNPMLLSELVFRYALVNPHASFTYEYDGNVQRYNRTADTCSKWVASDPTSVYWYSQDALRGLVAANLKAGRDITVREFVSEFRGLSSTAKQKAVTDGVGLSGARLSSLVVGNDIDMTQIGALLAAMKEQSQPIKPQALGIIGADHVQQWLTEAGAMPGFIEYRTEKGETVDGLPFVVECAIGVCNDRKSWAVVTGLNWTPTLARPSHKIGELLNVNRIEPEDPIIAFIHIACPRFSFTDRGKTTLELDGIIANNLARLIELNAAKWKKVKKQDEKATRARQRLQDECERNAKRKEMSIKEACRLVMVDALNEASDNGRLPAMARQVMYAARRLAQVYIGDRWFKHDKTFTQQILPDWANEHAETANKYDVVYDDRGRFTEPHRGESIGVGTISVRKYIGRHHGTMRGCHSDNFRPGFSYGAVLFIEKEGFQHILTESGIADRYDIALLSTKGFTVTAARMLAEDMTRRGVKIFVLHDFDKAGLGIEHTFKSSNRRWTFDESPDIVDIGVRLADVENLGLEGESVTYTEESDPRDYLRKIGATKRECNYLVSGHDYNTGQWKGQRVEINALSARQFVDFIEEKLQAHGVKKVMAGKDVLSLDYKHRYRSELINLRLEEYQHHIEREFANFDTDVPEDLHERVSKLCVTGKSTSTWDHALGSVVLSQLQKDEEKRNTDNRVGLYAKVSPETHARIADLAERAGCDMGTIIEALIHGE